MATHTHTHNNNLEQSSSFDGCCLSRVCQAIIELYQLVLSNNVTKNGIGNWRSRIIESFVCHVCVCVSPLENDD